MLFRFALAIIEIIKDRIMQATEFPQLFKSFEEGPKSITNWRKLIKIAYSIKFRVKREYIERRRQDLSPLVYEEIRNQSILREEGFNVRSPQARMKFLNKFYLFSGFSKLRSQQLKQQSNSEDFENQVVAEMDCSQQWPVCLYDFTYKNKCSSFFSFRVQNSPPLIEDYFSFSEDKSCTTKTPEILVQLHSLAPLFMHDRKSASVMLPDEESKHEEVKRGSHRRQNTPTLRERLLGKPQT